MSIIHNGRSVRRWLGASIALGALSVAVACSDSTSTAPALHHATAIRIFDGNFQTGIVSRPIYLALSVEVRDERGQLMPSATVTFSSTGNATFSNRETLSDTLGIASTYITLGTVMGTYTVTATVDGVAEAATFTLQANPGQAMQLAQVAGNGQTGAPGQRLTAPFIVKCVDLFGNPVAGLSVTWTVAGGGTLSEMLSVTDNNGEADVLLTLGSSTGNQTVVAHVQNLADVQFVTVVH